MKTFVCVSTLVVGLGPLLAQCASTSNSVRAPKTPATATAAEHATPVTHGTGLKHRICPMEVPQSTVAERDVKGGAELVFTTTSDQVSSLRENARSIAEVYNHHPAGSIFAEASGSQANPNEPPDDHYLTMPTAVASVEDIDHGARLLLLPEDPAELARLRQLASMHAARMVNGRCVAL